MAVGMPTLNDLPEIAGFKMASCACGIKKNGATDLLLVAMDPPCQVAGLFTTNQVVAAPVTLCRQRLAEGRAGALIVNSGNANVANGPQGMSDALAISREVAQLLSIPEESVFAASTGVIGEPLPVAAPLAAIPNLVRTLKPNNWKEAACAIMTTDTVPKGATRQVEIGGKRITINGIAKGAGMIHPNMATMLAFLFTDAHITAAALQQILSKAAANSFNCVSVDGDTSTNDTLLAFASGQADNPLIDDIQSTQVAPFLAAVNDLCQELAQWLIRDGEGAVKFVSIIVEGATDEKSAKQIANSVAKSPLVKTAFAGSDPNWGRILCAIGYAGVPFAVDLIDIFLAEVQIVKGGVRNPEYREQQGKEVMNRQEISIRIDLHGGSASSTVWTCDLTHDYISINADYRS
ncbi:MAG: bifunctional glutamate N-acetyltransferase/amino-acid acetyltransferase ArgJ [Magnetococcales bacterium]|nr:bifunctional glutamate N-acetyltransferase/amino-acid acetyltransferase ArgJ [Magnetococcales bacterium]